MCLTHTCTHTHGNKQATTAQASLCRVSKISKHSNTNQNCWNLQFKLILPWMLMMTAGNGTFAECIQRTVSGSGSNLLKPGRLYKKSQEQIRDMFGQKCVSGVRHRRRLTEIKGEKVNKEQVKLFKAGQPIKEAGWDMRWECDKSGETISKMLKGKAIIICFHILFLFICIYCKEVSTYVQKTEHLAAFGMLSFYNFNIKMINQTTFYTLDL